MPVPKTKKVVSGGGFKAKIEGVPGSNYLVVNLADGEKIMTSPGSLVYMKGDILKGEVELGGFAKAFARGLGGESFFITTYKGGAKGGEIAFGSDIPGDIIRVDLKAGEEYIISRGSFLCCTDNLEISATTRIRGILSVGQEEGFVLPVIRAKETAGSVWLCAYGTFKEINLVNEEIILDNGTFLACPSSLSYTLTSLGRGPLAFVFGGESLGMKFVGSGRLIVQSKNLNAFIGMMANSGSSSGSISGAIKEKVGEKVGDSIFDMFTEGGGARITKSKKKTKKLIKC